MKVTTIGLIFAFLFATCAHCVAGTTGVMHGYVRDSVSGQPVADALVTVASPSQTATTYTDKRGFFVFLTLPPDVYVVRAEKEGTSGAYAPDVRINSDQTTFLNLRVGLRLCGPTLTRVTVAAYQGSADIWSLDVRQMSKYPPNTAPLILLPAVVITQPLMCL